MTLKINNEVIKKFKQAGFYPDTMFAAYAAIMGLHLGKTELLDLWDDYTGSRRAVLIYYDLVDKGLWKECSNPPLNFEETSKGTMFAEELVQLNLEEPVPAKSTESDVESWIQSWIELFPKGVKSGGKLLRSDKKACLLKMKSFIKDYKFNKETILRATEEYLNEREKEGWLYTRCAIYFIGKKGEGSDLAARCADLEDKGKNNEALLYTTNSGLI